jgi:AraC-like DNA-binding protein
MACGSEREGGLMRIEIDLGGVPKDEQLDFWQAVTPSAYRVGRSASRQTHDLKTFIWTLPGMMANRFSAGAHMTSRELPGLRRSHARFVKVRLYKDGGSEIHHDGGVSRLRPCDVHVIDHSRPWSAYYHGTHQQHSIFIPHDLIGYDSTAHPVVRTFPKKSPEGLLLHHAIRSFFEGLSRGEKHQDRLLALVAAALRNGLRGSRDADIRLGREDALTSFVGGELDDRFIEAGDLAKAFGVSRATIFRAFESAGGLRRFQYDARLRAARDRLTEDGPERGTVCRLARELGFSSVAHFSDAFLDRYGVRPSEAGRLDPVVHERAGTISINDPRDLDATLRLSQEAYGRMTG